MRMKVLVDSPLYLGFEACDINIDIVIYIRAECRMILYVVIPWAENGEVI
jgi:hypothetical protein